MTNQRRRGQYVSSEELEACRADPEYETKQGWIKEFVVCRECSQKRASIATAHLTFHELTWKTYQAKWPNAPMLSETTYESVKKAARNYIAKDRPRHREASSKWRKANPTKIKEYDQHKRLDPEWREQRRTWEREEYYPRKKELFRSRRTVRKAKLAEAERILAQRTPAEIVEAARITLGAHLQLEGVTKRAMRHDLFPKQHILDRRYDDTKQFFRRKKSEIEAEKLRLSGMSPDDRETTVESARSHL